MESIWNLRERLKIPRDYEALNRAIHILILTREINNYSNWVMLTSLNFEPTTENIFSAPLSSISRVITFFLWLRMDITSQAPLCLIQFSLNCNTMCEVWTKSIPTASKVHLIARAFEQSQAKQCKHFCALRVKGYSLNAKFSVVIVQFSE